MGRLLRTVVMCLAGIGVTAAAASAQTTPVGYGFVSPAFATYEGDSLAIFQAGGGGEARLGNTFGLGHIMMQEGESFHLWGPRISVVWRGK